jgi:hypothetical protein
MTDVRYCLLLKLLNDLLFEQVQREKYSANKFPPTSNGHM